MIAGHITSRTNQWVRLLRKLGTSRRARYEERSFVCDGMKLLEEARQSGMIIRFIFLQDDYKFDIPWLHEYTVYTAPREIMEYISTVENTQGVIFCCEMPSESPLCGQQLIMLDHLQDTGNLGTIIRSADAFGIDCIVLDGCADPYNPKTVRAAMGSLFRVKICTRSLLEAINQLKICSVKTYAAMLSDAARPISEISLAHAAIVIGNEGAGVSSAVADAADGHIILPMSGITESLNASVAASIVMWEIQKQR